MRKSRDMALSFLIPSSQPFSLGHRRGDHYWLFGHYHDNKTIDEKHILLWEQIVRVI